MSFQDLLTSAQKYFPSLQVKYKDQSWFMKLLGKIMFFNPGFMKTYTTTIGSTVYFPNETFVKIRPISGCVILMHELVHMYDEKKLTKPVFSFSYLFPQILVPIFLLMLFFVSWKIALPLALLSLAPLPAYFRMTYEKRAYISSLYTMQLLGKRLNFDPKLSIQASAFVKHFKDSSYYFMWPFGKLEGEFTQAVTDIQAGKRPYDSPVFDMLDDLVTKV
jgi:hypothetical protein